MKKNIKKYRLSLSAVIPLFPYTNITLNALFPFTNTPTFLILFFLSIFSLSSKAQESRKEINFPDIDGYKVVKCDFHSHTVFSDGLVWPSLRVTEAWQDGLDLICITDHLEYRPNKKNVSGDFNKSFEIAKKEADKYGIMCVNACEITKKLPAGHFNALFTKDNNAIFKDDIIESLKEAENQGAFLVWNHPGWQQKENIPVWYKEHSEIFQKGLMQGIEVVNDIYYAPLAFKWAIDSNLTIISGSDLHNPSTMDYKNTQENHRPICLVLAKEKSENSVKEALVDKRTLIWYKDLIIGKEKYLKELFSKSISIELVSDSLLNKNSFYIKVKNESSFDFKLKRIEDKSVYVLGNDYTITNNATTFIRIRKTEYELNQENNNQKFIVPVRIENLKSSPDNSVVSKIKLK